MKMLRSAKGDTVTTQRKKNTKVNEINVHSVERENRLF